MNNECKLVFKKAVDQAKKIWGDQVLNHAEFAILQAFDSGNGQFVYWEIRNDEDGVRGINVNVSDTLIELPILQISEMVGGFTKVQNKAENAAKRLYPDSEEYTAVQRYFNGQEDCHLATVVIRGMQRKTDLEGYVIKSIPYITVRSIIPLIQLPSTKEKISVFE